MVEFWLYSQIFVILTVIQFYTLVIILQLYDVINTQKWITFEGGFTMFATIYVIFKIIRLNNCLIYNLLKKMLIF